MKKECDVCSVPMYSDVFDEMDTVTCEGCW
jgi:hypothetical protein